LRQPKSDRIARFRHNLSRGLSKRLEHRLAGIGAIEPVVTGLAKDRSPPTAADPHGKGWTAVDPKLLFAVREEIGRP